MEGKKKIIMLGTGSATVTKCYNTCFMIKTEESMLMVDAGGGNGILNQLQKANINICDIHNLYVTHAHTDHILGVIWIVRMIMQKTLAGKYDGVLNVYGHEKAIQVITEICRMTLHKKYFSLIGSAIQMHVLDDGDRFNVGDMQLQCFDILSEKEKQFGFTVRFDDDKRLVCMGDEPCNEATLHYAKDADWMMCEAFCLYSDRDIFKPYEKYHSTALDAGKLAAGIGVKNLIIYHTEDTDLDHRKEKYSEEVRKYFKGNVVVPDDLEEIIL